MTRIRFDIFRIDAGFCSFIQEPRIGRSLGIIDTQEDDIVVEPKKWDFTYYKRYASILIVLLFRVFAMTVDLHVPYQQGVCQCSLKPDFQYFPEQNTTSAIMNTGIKVQCDVDGRRYCISMCTLLARRPPTPFWDNICVNQPDNTKFSVPLYYRSCSKIYWRSTEKRMTVCCRGGAAHYCPRNAYGHLTVETYSWNYLVKKMLELIKRIGDYCFPDWFQWNVKWSEVTIAYFWNRVEFLYRCKNAHGSNTTFANENV